MVSAYRIFIAMSFQIVAENVVWLLNVEFTFFLELSSDRWASIASDIRSVVEEEYFYFKRFVQQ